MITIQDYETAAAARGITLTDDQKRSLIRLGNTVSVSDKRDDQQESAEMFRAENEIYAGPEFFKATETDRHIAESNTRRREHNAARWSQIDKDRTTEYNQAKAEIIQARLDTISK